MALNKAGGRVAADGGRLAFLPFRLPLRGRFNGLRNRPPGLARAYARAARHHPLGHSICFLLIPVVGGPDH